MLDKQEELMWKEWGRSQPLWVKVGSYICLGLVVAFWVWVAVEAVRMMS